jgi:hypothetical protein
VKRASQSLKEFLTSHRDCGVYQKALGLINKWSFFSFGYIGHYEFNWYRYFLNHSNHAPDIPLDMISYHFYATSTSRTDPNGYEAFFPQLDTFTNEIKQIEQIRKALSPETRTTIDELGIILPDDNAGDAPQFPLVYWNAGGAYYAYAWAKISRQGIDVVGHSQLVGKYSSLRVRMESLTRNTLLFFFH